MLCAGVQVVSVASQRRVGTFTLAVQSQDASRSPPRQRQRHRQRPRRTHNRHTTRWGLLTDRLSTLSKGYLSLRFFTRTHHCHDEVRITGGVQRVLYCTAPVTRVKWHREILEDCYHYHYTYMGPCAAIRMTLAEAWLRASWKTRASLVTHLYLFRSAFPSCPFLEPGPPINHSP